MKRLLITGFDPFGGQSVNPSWEAVRRLPEKIADFQIFPHRIPTVFHAAGQQVLSLAASVHPDVILCVGQAGGRKEVTPERIGINLRSASICDNEGNQPVETPIVPQGPAAYFSTLPVPAMTEAIRKAGFPSAVSNSAGTFVCNDVLYTLLHHYAGSPVQVGFIHLPYLPEQGAPSLSLEDMVQALIAAITAISSPSPEA